MVDQVRVLVSTLRISGITITWCLFGIRTDALLFLCMCLSVIHKFDYAFAENGLTAYKLGQELPSQSFIRWLGEDKYKPLVNFILHHIADLDLPIKRSVQLSCDLSSDISYSGTFVEFRNGMINVSPIGRNASWVQF